MFNKQCVTLGHDDPFRQEMCTKVYDEVFDNRGCKACIFYNICKGNGYIGLGMGSSSL